MDVWIGVWVYDHIDLMNVHMAAWIVDLRLGVARCLGAYIDA